MESESKILDVILNYSETQENSIMNIQYSIDRNYLDLLKTKYKEGVYSEKNQEIRKLITKIFSEEEELTQEQTLIRQLTDDNNNLKEMVEVLEKKLEELSSRDIRSDEVNQKDHLTNRLDRLKVLSRNPNIEELDEEIREDYTEKNRTWQIFQDELIDFFYKELNLKKYSRTLTTEEYREEKNKESDEMEFSNKEAGTKDGLFETRSAKKTKWIHLEAKSSQDKAEVNPTTLRSQQKDFNTDFIVVIGPKFEPKVFRDAKTNCNLTEDLIPISVFSIDAFCKLAKFIISNNLSHQQFVEFLDYHGAILTRDEIVGGNYNAEHFDDRLLNDENSENIAKSIEDLIFEFKNKASSLFHKFKKKILVFEEFQEIIKDAGQEFLEISNMKVKTKEIFEDLENVNLKKWKWIDLLYIFNLMGVLDFIDHDSIFEYFFDSEVKDDILDLIKNKIKFKINIDKQQKAYLEGLFNYWKYLSELT